MEDSLGVMGFRVKVDNNLGGTGITHEESILNWR